MPRKATASVRARRDKWEARVTLGPKSRRSFYLPTCSTEAAARDRADVLAGLAQRLRDAGHADLAPQFIRRAAERDDEGLSAVVEAVDRLCSGRVVIPSRAPGAAVTFRAFAEQWTSGELHRQWPDHVNRKKSADDDRTRLERHVYPLVGHVPLAEFSLDDADRVMRALPESLSRGSRRHVAQLMHRIFAMAVFPARILATNPLPRGFLPSPKSQKAMTYLYPDEERTLLGCAEVPLGRRVLYGFLTREGDAPE